MRDYPSLSQTRRTSKVVVKTEGGVVAAQNSAAARIGAEILAQGGDAVDAAVAVSFAIGQREPWMSGPAGGGAMMVWRADEGRAHALRYGMQAPAALDPADYPLAGTGKASDLFPWDVVVDDRNQEGATAVAVPGVVAGAGMAHDRWGRMPWADLLAPGIEEAKAGLPIDWYATLLIAGVAKALSKDPDCAARFLDEGCFPPAASWVAATQRRLDLGKSADTLSTLAAEGWRAFYEGDIAEALAKDVQDKGGCLSAQDLRDYSIAFEDPLSFSHGKGRFHVTPTLTAGPTFREALDALAAIPGATAEDAPGAAFYPAFVKAMKTAYESRLSAMGDEFESPKAPACTTHFSIVDRQGNMVAMTQTLLSIFGSRVVSPSTGFLLNNGIMWFDPAPGNPNSLAPGKRCLMNVCPVIGETDDGARFAFGASGGRKIVGAVAQLSLYATEFGMDVGEAFHAPRLDVSGGEVATLDQKLPEAVRQAVAEMSPVQEHPREVYPLSFACPAGVMRKDGLNSGCTEVMSPWGDAIPEDGLTLLEDAQ